MAPQTRSKARVTTEDVNRKKTGDEGAMGIFISFIINFYAKYLNLAFVKKSLTDPEYTWLIALILLGCELFINGFIVLWRPCKNEKNYM